MERFLYRLSKSAFCDRFVLKGALLLTAWRAPVSRPTIDIDLSGRTGNDLEHIRSIFDLFCQSQVEPDGIEFDPATVEVSRIAEDADYEGVRARFNGLLARARIPMQIDVGFGDVIVPGPTEIAYPTLLNFPAPRLMAYPRETVIAEKLEALTQLGLLNSRMKDFYDLALLARLYSFDGTLLARGILATFGRRNTRIKADPVGLSESFSLDPAKALQWRAFLKRSRFKEHLDFVTVVDRVRNFAHPVLDAISGGRSFDRTWTPGGPWTA
jgi:predicted nucleotidyltransferase component of viral defense system